MARGTAGESRYDVKLTNLDEPLFDESGTTKRALVDYLDGIGDRILPGLADRALSVIRVHRGQVAFMQKNVPKYTPDWVETIRVWAGSAGREVTYALCNDRRTLIWFANQRAVEFHPGLVLAASPEHMTHLILDLDPPEGAPFSAAVRATRAVRRALEEVGLDGAVKTSGAKGLHVFVPITAMPIDDAAAATRAIAAAAERIDPEIATTAFIKSDRAGKVFVDATRVGAGATVAAAYTPRLRPGVPVSFPVAWDHLDAVQPADFTLHTALDLLGDRDPWSEAMPGPQPVPDALVEAGRAIPSGRVEAMHEGKRRARAARD
ncbi:MAG: ATP-dependent DNA ligase [Acidimicrobiia bacterium]